MRRRKIRSLYFSFRKVSVCVRFSGDGVRWYNFAKKIFGGFDLRKQNILEKQDAEVRHKRKKKLFVVSSSSFVDFWKIYKRLTRYIVRKTLLSERERLAFIHASAVYNRRKIYIILGKSGFGKSTACKILLQKGFGYISDDTVIIDVKKKVLFVFPKPIEIKSAKGIKIYPVYDVNKEIKIGRKKIAFIILKRQIKSEKDYRDFVRIFRNTPEIRLEKLQAVDGVLMVLRNTANLRNLDESSYLKIISRSSNDFYLLRKI